MYMNNFPRFPIGDDGSEIELTSVFANTCNCQRQNSCRNNCQSPCNNSSCTMPSFADTVARAIVYSPDHEFDNMYETDAALERGTLFKYLDKPFEGTTITGGNYR